MRDRTSEFRISLNVANNVIEDKLKQAREK